MQCISAHQVTDTGRLWGRLEQLGWMSGGPAAGGKRPNQVNLAQCAWRGSMAASE